MMERKGDRKDGSDCLYDDDRHTAPEVLGYWERLGTGVGWVEDFQSGGASGAPTDSFNLYDRN